MKIKEVASRLNISPRAIRFYEEKGLLSPIKEPANLYRTFSEKDIWRLQTIISLREAGMSVADIRLVLEKWDENDKEELQYYLELQRSVMMSEWLQIKQVVETTDHMIELLKTKQSLPLEHIFRLAEASKQLREHRGNWKDKWDYNQQAPTHDERVAANTGNYADYDKALDLIVRLVSPSGDEQGLDIGTGTGNLAARFMERGISMSGVDQSKEMLRHCQRKYPALETRIGNFLALPYLEEQFDFVVSSFAFHHLTPDQQLLALEEMRRVLKPGGRICIADLMNSEAHEGSTSPNYPAILMLRHWFENSGYRVEITPMNEWLHIIYACKEERNHA
ncbi:MerR family transcriptional regulator [Cohnella luojiensis]|uniref:Methyltransferase domain-containing protein n=1 Tax=Cohnella luojiensis TaxID=652876 RepID=A0A4Y8LYQ1_9BACL|nr:methyltransferase domain-containing protein [Cohnella luojiensis]TFE24506.1 methyltransferase domain-containing protein [Cohnella luojiensis]